MARLLLDRTAKVVERDLPPGKDSCTGIPPILAEDHRNTLEVPRSPTTYASTDDGLTPSRSATCTRRRKLSRYVPAPNARSCFVRWRATSANGSGGSVAIRMTACGAALTMPGTMSSNTFYVRVEQAHAPKRVAPVCSAVCLLVNAGRDDREAPHRRDRCRHRDFYQWRERDAVVHVRRNAFGTCTMRLMRTSSPILVRAKRSPSRSMRPRHLCRRFRLSYLFPCQLR